LCVIKKKLCVMRYVRHNFKYIDYLNWLLKLVFIKAHFLKLVIISTVTFSQQFIQMVNNQVFSWKDKTHRDWFSCGFEKKLTNDWSSFSLFLIYCKIVDIFTKTLSQSVFKNLYSKLGMKNIYSHLRKTGKIVFFFGLFE